MKFIQLLSTIASLAIFATAPGVSAAGLRAGAGGDAVDKKDEAEASGRRNLQGGMMYGLPGQVSGMPGMPGMSGMSGMHYGMPGTVAGMPTGPNMYTPPAAYYDYGDEGNYGDNYDYDDEDYDYDNSGVYSGGGGNGGDADDFCRKFKTRPACRAHDHDTCGWDDSQGGCHSY